MFLCSIFYMSDQIPNGLKSLILRRRSNGNNTLWGRWVGRVGNIENFCQQVFFAFQNRLLLLYIFAKDTFIIAFLQTCNHVRNKQVNAFLCFVQDVKGSQMTGLDRFTEPKTTSGIVSSKSWSSPREQQPTKVILMVLYQRNTSVSELRVIRTDVYRIDSYFLLHLSKLT